MIKGMVQEEIDLTLDPKKVIASAERLKKTLQSITNAIDGEQISSEFQEIVDLLTETAAESDKVNESIKNGNLELVADSAALNNIMRENIDKALGKLEEFNNEQDLIKQKADGVYSALTQIAQGTIRNMKNILRHIKQVVSHIAKIGVAVVKSGLSKLKSIFFGASNASGSFSQNLKRGIRTVLSYGFGIQTLASLFNKLRSAATETFQRMAQQIPEVNRDMSALMNSIQNLKNSIGTAFQPLLAALTPILTKIASMLTNVITKVGEFFAALTGQKYVYKATAANLDYAKSLDKSTKAAKKNQNQLGEYDKLQVIGKKDEDGGGGYDTDAAKGAFQKVPIDPKMMKFLDWLKDMWKKGNFFELGAKFAEWLKNTLKKIPWDKIKAIAANLGKSFATFFNGIFNDLELAQVIGKTIGEALNTALEFAYNFVKFFDFRMFGLWIGNLISHLGKTIDWDKLKELGTMFGKGLADSINAFLSTDALVEVGRGIGNFFRAIVNFAWKFITTIQWDKLGDRLREALNGALNRMLDVDADGKSGFAKLGEAISGLITGILTTVNKVLGDSATREKIGKAITEFLNGIDFQAILSQSAQLIANVAKLIGTVIKSALASEGFRTFLLEAAAILLPMLGTIFGISLFGAVASFAAKTFITEFIKAFITEGIASGAFAELGATIMTALSGIGSAIVSLLPVIALVGAAILVWVHNWDAIKEAGQLFVERTKEHLESLKQWWTSTVETIKTFVTTKFNELKQNVTNSLQILQIVANYAWTNIKNAAMTAWTTLSNGIVTIWNSVIQAVSNSLKSIQTAFVNVFTGIYNFVVKVINGITSAISFVGSAISSLNLGGVGATIKSHIPHLAQGAVIPPNKEFIATLGDQKSGTNIETPLNTMIEAFKVAMQEMGGAGSNNQPIMLQLDGRTVAQAVWSEENKRYKQTGQYRPRTV